MLKITLLFTLSCNCREGANCKFLGKNPQVHLIIIREWPKTNPPILRNLDNFPPGAFYSNLPPFRSPTPRTKE